MMRVRTDFKGVKTKIDRMANMGRYILASQVLADSNNYVPELSGDLKRYSIVSNDHKSIIWNQPYARYQYYGNFKNYTKPGTGGRWDERAKKMHLQSWINLVERGMK